MYVGTRSINRRPRVFPEMLLTQGIKALAVPDAAGPTSEPLISTAAAAQRFLAHAGRVRLQRRLLHFCDGAVAA